MAGTLARVLQAQGEPSGRRGEWVSAYWDFSMCRMVQMAARSLQCAGQGALRRQQPQLALRPFPQRACLIAVVMVLGGHIPGPAGRMRAAAQRGPQRRVAPTGDGHAGSDCGAAIGMRPCPMHASAMPAKRQQLVVLNAACLRAAAGRSAGALGRPGQARRDWAGGAGREMLGGRTCSCGWGWPLPGADPADLVLPVVKALGGPLAVRGLLDPGGNGLDDQLQRGQGAVA